MISFQVESFGKPLAQVLRETPQPTGSEVLVKVGSCGVCHSDVHLHDGYFDLGGDVKLDMTRTVVNITGDSMVTTVVAKSEGELDIDVFNDPEAGYEYERQKIGG